MQILYSTLNPKQRGLNGWAFFWAKTVTGFDPSVHCQACLIGERIWSVKGNMRANVEVTEDFDEGTILYICGVAEPWSWKNNFHLVVRAKKGANCQLQTYQGDTVYVKGGSRIAINAVHAKELYPNKGPKFLTCRNYQFGAQLAAEIPELREQAALREPQFDLNLLT